MSALRLVTFDVTGTLLNFRRPVINQYAEVAAQFNFKVDPDRLYVNFKTTWTNLWDQHPNFGQSTGLGWQEWWHQIVKGTFMNEIDGSNDRNSATIRKISGRLIEHFKTADAWEVVEGSVDLLESLKSDKIAIGVISNFDPRLHDILQNVNLKKYFSFVLTSYEVGHAKPSHIIFHRALNTIGLRNGLEALHVGNDPKLDYGGATTAGINSVLISQQSPLLLPKLVNRISQVRDCIDLINNGCK